MTAANAVAGYCRRLLSEAERCWGRGAPPTPRLGKLRDVYAGWITQTPNDAAAERQAELDTYLDDHGTWDAARARFAQASDGMDEELRSEALAALDVLERELGPTWPRDAMFVDDGPGAFLGNAAPWTARQVVVVAQDFELLKDDQAFESVVRKLRKPRDGHAASSLFQIHVAALARRRGLHAALEPPSNIGKKKLDVLVRSVSDNESQEFYIECTANQAIPDAAKLPSEAAWRLRPFDLVHRGIQARVDLAPELDAGQRVEAEQHLTQLYDAVQATGEPREVVIDGLLYAWAAPVDHHDLPTLIATRGEPGLYEPFAHDPLHRLLATVERKLRQLRRESANVIAIRPSRLLRQVPIDRVRQSLREAQMLMPMLSAVAMFHQFWGHHHASTHSLSDGDSVTITDLFAPVHEEVIVVWNPARSHVEADDLINQHLAPPELGAWIDV